MLLKKVWTWIVKQRHWIALILSVTNVFAALFQRRILDFVVWTWFAVYVIAVVKRERITCPNCGTILGSR